MKKMEGGRSIRFKREIRNKKLMTGNRDKELPSWGPKGLSKAVFIYRNKKNLSHHIRNPIFKCEIWLL